MRARRTRRVSIRLTEEGYELLMALSEKMGLSSAQAIEVVVRNMMSGQVRPAAVPEKESESGE